jgi:hypothetical protein
VQPAGERSAADVPEPTGEPEWIAHLASGKPGSWTEPEIPWVEVAAAEAHSSGSGSGTGPLVRWNQPTPWTQPSRPLDDGPPKGRSPWRSAQMLFQRRYNAAAAITVAVVAVLLFLLAAIPIENHEDATAATRAASQHAAFPPSTFEAESPQNTLIGSATAERYPGASGGSLVRTIGDWHSPQGLGSLRFNNIVVPQDSLYVMTFYFVNIRGKATRTATITASGSESVSVTVASDSVCCTGQAVKIYLFKGTNSITFSNAGGEAPAIDRITIAAR